MNSQNIHFSGNNPFSISGIPAQETVQHISPSAVPPSDQTYDQNTIHLDPQSQSMTSHAQSMTSHAQSMTSHGTNTSSAQNYLPPYPQPRPHPSYETLNHSYPSTLPTPGPHLLPSPVTQSLPPHHSYQIPQSQFQSQSQFQPQTQSQLYSSHGVPDHVIRALSYQSCSFISQQNPAVTAYCNEIPKISFFDAFSNTRFLIGPHKDFNTPASGFKSEWVHNRENVLLKILNNEQKIKHLSTLFDVFINTLTQTWSQKELEMVLTCSLHFNSPDIVFDFTGREDFNNGVGYKQLITPLVNFKSWVSSLNILSDLELKIIMTMICDSLNIFTTSYHPLDKLNADWDFVIEVLMLKGKSLYVPKKAKNKFNQKDYSLFLTLFLQDLKKLTFEKILNGYEFSVSCSSLGNKIITFYQLHRINHTETSKEVYKLMIVPKNIPGENNKKEVLLYPLKIQYRMNLPTRFSQVKRLNQTRGFFLNLQKQIKQLIDVSSNTSTWQSEQSEIIIKYTKLLVDNRCNSEMLTLALKKCVEEQFETPIYNFSYARYDQINFLPLAAPCLKNVTITTVNELVNTLPHTNSVTEIVSNVPIDLSYLPQSSPTPLTFLPISNSPKPPPPIVPFSPPSSSFPSEFSQPSQPSPFPPPPNPSNPPPIAPSSSTPPTSSMEFYNLDLKDLTLDKLKTIEIPPILKEKWSEQLNFIIKIWSKPQAKKGLIQALKHSLEATGKCHIDLDYLRIIDPVVAQEVIGAILFEKSSYEDVFINRFLKSFFNIQLNQNGLIPNAPSRTASQRIIPNHTKLDYSLIDLNELSELIYNYYIDSLKIKASNPDSILKLQRYDFFQINSAGPLFQYKDLLPPIAKPCFYLVRPPEEENPEIHCFQIYMNEVYDIYAIGKDSPENEVSNHLASILGIDRSLLLPSSYGEGFSLKNSEMDLLWKYYAAHPEEFILLSSLSMQSQEEFDASPTNSIKRGKNGKRRLLEPNSTPSFPDKLKAKRRKHGSEGPDLDEDASMEDPSQSASLPPSESEGSQNPNSAQLAVLPSMPLTSPGYKLPEMNLSNPFASLMFKLTQESMGFVKKHLEKVEKYTLKNDDQLFSITSSLRQRIGVQTHTMSQFYCASLKEYQQDSASWMLNMSKNGLGGILASEPGLGKTLTAIEWIMQQQKMDSSHRPILIVVPKTIASQWRESLYQQNQNWLSCQFAQLIQKAKVGENIDLASLCDYLNIFLQSHLAEITVLEKRLKGLPNKENGEENPTHSYVKLQLENRQKWLQEAQSFYDDLFFNAPIIPHMIAQWKKEINQRHISQEERERLGRKFALIASNIIEKMLLKDIPDWGSRVEQGLKAFSLFKYGKLLNALKPALQQKNLQEIRAALCSYLFQYNEDVKNLGQLLENLSPLSQPSAALNSEIDSATPISPEIGIRANFYSLVNVISEPPKSYAELTPLKVNIEKPYSILITTKDTLRILRRKNQSASQKSLEKRKEKENFIDFLKTLSWGGVIWDEAQLQVWDLSQGESENDTSFAYRFLKSLSQNSREMAIMLLTGTPFVNTYGDTLSLFSMSNPHISLQSYSVEILNREARLKSALENLERAKKIQMESQKKNEASIKRCTRSFLKCLENVIVAYAHMKKVQAALVRINRFDDRNVQQSWTTEQGVKMLPQKEAIEISCPLKPKQKELIRSIQQGFKSGEKSLFRLLDSSHKIVFHPDLNGKKLVDKSNPELEAIKKKIKAFNAEEQNKFIDESGFLTAFFKGLETASEQPSASFQISPFKEALKTPESILIIVSRIFEGVILKQLLENQFKYENRTNAKVWFFDGSASTEQREHMVRAYESASYFSKIFILSVKSGGVGLDLKSTTIGFNLASKWAQWNNSGLLQAEARMYRANTMGVKRMYTFNTGTLVEQCVHHAVIGKRLFSQFLFYSEESIKKEIELYLNALEARCIKTEVDLSIENMEERKAKIHELFVMVRVVVDEAPQKYFESFQKRLSMATDLNYNISQESISRSIAPPKMVEKDVLNTEGGVKRKSGERLNEVNKGKKKKTGVLTVPASKTEISQLESKSSLPQVSNHSSAAAPLTSPSAPLTSASVPLTSASASLTSASAPLTSASAPLTSAAASLTVAIPSFNAPSAAAATLFTSPVPSVGSVSDKRKKYNSFSNRVANFTPPPLFQPKLSQSGQGIVPLKTHYEVGVSGGHKINVSVMPIRDCFDIKNALQIGVCVSRNGQKMGNLLKAMRNLPSQEWQSLLEDPEAFMKTNHQNHDLNVNAVKTMIPTFFGIEQTALQSPTSQEDVLKNYNSDIYVLKDGKLVHEKGLRATNPTSSTCTIRLLKLPLAGNSNRFKFHLLLKSF